MEKYVTLSGAPWWSLDGIGWYASPVAAEAAADPEREKLHAEWTAFIDGKPAGECDGTP